MNVYKEHVGIQRKPVGKSYGYTVSWTRSVSLGDAMENATG